MQGYNVIVVFDNKENRLLMCKRRNNPFKGLRNFVGGRIEKGESGTDAAYRELFEETSITKDDIVLCHLMDFKYYIEEIKLEVYVGKLNKQMDVSGDENELMWVDVEEDFFDTNRYAGMGNIGHIMMHVNKYRNVCLDKKP